MHLTGLGAFAHALPLLHLLCVLQPLVFLAQPGQRRARQRIEGALAGRTAVALQPRGAAPAGNLVVPALGAQGGDLYPAFYQGIDRLQVFDLAQALSQQFSLVGCQLVNLRSQCLKFFSFHRRTYVVDLHGFILFL